MSDFLVFLIKFHLPLKESSGIQYSLGSDPIGSTTLITFCPSRSTISTGLNCVVVSVAVTNSSV